MPDIFLTVGASVVKAALQVWLRGDTPAADASASIVDLLRTRLSGDLDQRKAQRFFEDLEVPISHRLKTLRDKEFPILPNYELNAAVLAAGISFDRAKLNTQKLLVRDLDPLSLEQLIRADSQAATRDLSADGTAFYDRMISEGAAYIVEIADKLPRFQVGAFTELLRRDREILHLITEVLDRIPEKASGKGPDARFRTAYVRHLATKLDRLELFGLDFESSWYQLSIAYISLRTSDTELAEAQSIEDWLAAHQRGLVIGRAGSGKTTILQWLAVRAARADFTTNLALFNGYVPFFVRLREYVNKSLPTPEEFIVNVAPMLVSETPESWIRNRLRNGQAFVLIDGLDELPNPERDRVASWLADLIDLFPSVRYVITARPAAIHPDLLSGLGFSSTSLEAMSPSLVAAFIRQWHQAARHTSIDNEDRERLSRYETSLLTAVEDDRYLRDLADTPLLAGLLCALNRHLRSQLPRRRGEIYDRALTMFDQRDRARDIGTGVAVLDLAAKSHLLSELALWMIRNGKSEIDSESVIDLLTRSLTTLPTYSKFAGADVCRFLLERSGLLREPAADRIDFVHRTFQEYLAARAAVHENAIGELVRNAGDVQWREVVVLAAGQANRPQATQLIQGLLGRPISGSRRVRRILAVACVQEIDSIDLFLRRSVEDVIPGLLPPQTIEQAEQLSGVGLRLIPVLSRQWKRDQKRVPETIRAASLIGGPAALDLIEMIAAAYSGRGVRRIHSEATRAWQYFDAEDYARRVLGPLGADNQLIADLRQLKAARHLTSANAVFLEPPAADGSDLSSLAALPQLGNLTVAGMDNQGLRALAVLSNLNHLGLWYFTSGDLSNLPQLPDVTTLSIIDPPRLTSLYGIERLPRLIHIELSGCASLQHLGALVGLPELKSIKLHRCGKLDVQLLADRPELQIAVDDDTFLLHSEMLPRGALLHAIEPRDREK